MNIKKLKTIAESLETALLEKVAISDISDFSIDVIPDDYLIEVVMIKIVPVKEIKVTLNIKRVSPS